MLNTKQTDTHSSLSGELESGMPAVRARQAQSNAQVMKHLLLDPINLLMLAAPVGLAGAKLQWSAALVFSLCFAGLIPLAKLLGDATEHLAENLNQTVGGILNATFGNAVEMIITVSAIRAGLLDIVKQSTLGSILSNLLLVLGMSFFAGGLYKTEQRFHDAAALLNTTMLFVGAMAFSMPTVFSFSAPPGSILQISRVSAIFVGIGYVAYLVFQLYTHIDVFEDEQHAGIDEGAADAGAPMEEEEEEEETLVLSIPWSLSLLTICTLVVAILSELMVGSIEGLVKDYGVPQGFVGVILLPIVGNACEHASAIRMALHDKCGAAIAIAVGSSTQMTLLAMPFAVLAAWVVGEPLDFNLSPTGITVLTMSVLVVFSIVLDGRSNWLEGFMLMLAYCLVAVLYWYVPEAHEHVMHQKVEKHV